MSGYSLFIFIVKMYKQNFPAFQFYNQDAGYKSNGAEFKSRYRLGCPQWFDCTLKESLNTFSFQNYDRSTLNQPTNKRKGTDDSLSPVKLRKVGIFYHRYAKSSQYQLNKTFHYVTALYLFQCINAEVAHQTMSSEQPERISTVRKKEVPPRFAKNLF